jgi:hypothetical protein
MVRCMAAGLGTGARARLDGSVAGSRWERGQPTSSWLGDVPNVQRHLASMQPWFGAQRTACEFLTPPPPASVCGLVAVYLELQEDAISLITALLDEDEEGAGEEGRSDAWGVFVATSMAKAGLQFASL